MQDDLDLATRLIELAQRAGADAADVLVIRDTSLNVGVADGALEEIERAESREFGLRVLIGKRQACVSSSDPRPQSLGTVVERAVAIAEAAPDDPWCGLADPAQIASSGDVPDLDLTDTGEPPAPEALEEAARTGEAAAAAVPGITQVEQSHASWSYDALTLAASNGFSGAYDRTRWGVGVSAIAGHGLGRERDYASESRRYLSDLPDVDGIGRLAGERAVERLDPKRPPKGAYPVLFDQRVASSLISHLISALNGTSVARGASWLRESLGTHVLPEGLDVTEDPLIPRGPASRPFDAEGLAARKRHIVEDGILSGWTLDCATARQLGLSSTANARRGTGGPPSPGVTNVYLSAGQRSRQELISDMGKGLIVTSMIGASINPTTGSYSRGASGFWVENGAPAYPVNEITIAGSLPEFMRSIIPANDADPNRAISVPSLLVEGITIGA